MTKKTFQEQSFPIVALGGSAGAIEAVLQIVEHLPTHTGMAYIYLQHQNPDFNSKLSELLSKRAQMPVLLAEDDMPIEADFFYVIPPGKELVINDGTLHVTERTESYDHMPINRFFQSLAEQYKEFAIGIILSGADSDGTQGIKAIKSAGGLAFAQDDSAQFKTMPRSAIAEGAVDLVLSPKEIAEELKDLAKQKEAYYHALQNLNGESISNKDEDLQLIIQIVQKMVGADFSQYKMNTIKLRIVRRMALHRLNTLKEYIRFL